MLTPAEDGMVDWTQLLTPGAREQRRQALGAWKPRYQSTTRPQYNAALLQLNYTRRDRDIYREQWATGDLMAGVISILY